MYINTMKWNKSLNKSLTKTINPPYKQHQCFYISPPYRRLMFVQWLGVRCECSERVGQLLGGVGVWRGCTNRILNSSLSTNAYFYLHHKFHRISSVTYEGNTVRVVKGVLNIYALHRRHSSQCNQLTKPDTVYVFVLQLEPRTLNVCGM